MKELFLSLLLTGNFYVNSDNISFSDPAIDNEPQVVTTQQVEEQPKEKRVIKVKITYYSNIECGGNLGASGKRLEYGDVAAPKSISFGTKLNIENLGTFTVQDRGGAVKVLSNDVHVIDVYIPNASSATLNKKGTWMTTATIEE
jgi:3D (Asp-Asp-Asp) domain-containing protein